MKKWEQNNWYQFFRERISPEDDKSLRVFIEGLLSSEASIRGSLGGQKTALRGPDYYRQIGAKGGRAKRGKKKEENETKI